jgi:hypothetical protein
MQSALSSTSFNVLNSSLSYPYPTKWGQYNMFLIMVWIDSAIIFMTGRPAWYQPSLKLEGVLTIANAAGLNGFVKPFIS